MIRTALQSETFRKLNIFMIEYFIFFAVLLGAMLICLTVALKSISHAVIFYAVLIWAVFWLRKGLRKTSYISVLKVVR